VSSALVFSLSEPIVHAVSRLVDDYQRPREPTHSDIGATLTRAGLAIGDPHADSSMQRVGKQKRVRQALQWALDNDETAGANAVVAIVHLVRGSGGFLPDSPNYCGDDAIRTCLAAFAGESVELTVDGVLRPRNLGALSGRELSDALRSYVRRAQRGYEDSVLLSGTSKDIIEAAAAHVIMERYGTYPSQVDFPTLIGQAFVAVKLDAQMPKQQQGGLEGARTALSVALYELACAVNRLRNKAGAGHGRPFLPNLTPDEVRAATEAAGLVAGRLLDALEALC
jgi:hypothetical protein